MFEGPAGERHKLTLWLQLTRMSSSPLVSADKDQIRNRKSLFDSSSSSPHAVSRRQERVSRENRLLAHRRTEEDVGCKDFKKLYEGALAAKGRLQSRLDTSREELALVQSQLGRVTGQQQRRRAAERTSNMLETEKKENKSLEKKISDMEEELKAKAELTAENQRLKDENGALIRVISKLSK